jgi:hypothetical protein
VPEVHGREWSGGYDIKAVDMTRGSIAQYDCVVIITDHKAFDYDALVQEADVIVDNAQRDQGRPPETSQARRAALHRCHGKDTRSTSLVATCYDDDRPSSGSRR